MFLMSFFDTWIMWIEYTAHNTTPVTVRIIPAIGMNGTSGQSMIRTKLQIAPTMMMKVPAINKNNREKKPIKRDISLSRNMCIFRSSEESALAVSADI